MTDFFRLYDAIEAGMNTFYKREFTGGRYGSVKGVSLPRNGRAFHTKFYETDLDCSSPTGFLYPILGSFRALIGQTDGVYRWKTDPFAALDRVGGELVKTTVERSRSLGNNPQSTGKDSGHWKTLYMTVRFDLED